LTRIALILILVDVLVCVLAVVDGGNRPNRHFIEGGIITWLNALQLLLSAGVACLIYRRRTAENVPPGEAAGFWLLVALGSVYLAIDEVATIHESIGHYLQEHHVPHPPLLNGYGDVVLLLYGVLVLAICWRFRREIWRDHQSLKFLALGATLLVVSESLDFFGVHEGRERFWWSVAEESCKFTGFGAMLGGVLLRARGTVAPRLLPMG